MLGNPLTRLSFILSPVSEEVISSVWVTILPVPDKTVQPFLTPYAIRTIFFLSIVQCIHSSMHLTPVAFMSPLRLQNFLDSTGK